MRRRYIKNILRDFDLVEYPSYDVFRGLVLRLGLVTGYHPVPQYVRSDGFHVLRRDVTSPLYEGESLGGDRKVYACPGRGAVLDEPREFAEAVIGRFARCDAN